MNVLSSLLNFIGNKLITYGANISTLQTTVSGINTRLASGDFYVGDYGSGSMKSINKSGIYYVYNGVSDKPISAGGLFVVRFAQSGGRTGAGIFVTNSPAVTGSLTYRVSIVDGVWKYDLIQ